MTIRLDDEALAVFLIGTKISNNLPPFLTPIIVCSIILSLNIRTMLHFMNWNLVYPLLPLLKIGLSRWTILISPDCESSPGDLIRLFPCPGCAAHIPLPPSKKRNTDLTFCILTVSLRHSLILPTTNERIRRNTSEVTSPFTWADIEDDVRLYYSRLDFNSDSSSVKTAVAPVAPVTIESSVAAIFANSPLVVSSDSRYIFSLMGLLLI
ncbi:hypothetical protein RhiirB3_456858 [Rhizophagus irregularis]|nr:hypothetical protein RhiirB3_456858 [Rhizophagus irregularis]